MSGPRKQIVRWQSGRRQRLLDEVAREEPLEIRVDGQSFLVTMRTPGHDQDLALGLLFSERIVSRFSEVREIRPNPRNRSGNSLDVFLDPGVSVARERFARRGFVSSSCGLCGLESIRAIRHQFPAVRSSLRISAGLLLQLPGRLRAAQSDFARTGGLHAAGIFTAGGELLVAREDIGRHNAVDKVIGHGLRQGWLPYADHILVVSGRASFEIMQKALAARVPVVAAVSAPSSLAVEFARAAGQTLFGFLREERLNVYSAPTRIVFPTSPDRG